MFEGRVVDDAGEALEGVQIYAVGPGKHLRINPSDPRGQQLYLVATSGDAGAFRFTPRPHHLVVAIHDRGYARQTVADLKAADGRLVLEPWATLRGQAYIGREPAAGVTVRVDAHANARRVLGSAMITPRLTAQTDADGGFRIERVPPGPVLVSLTKMVEFDPGTGRKKYTSARLANTAATAEPGATLEVTLGGTGRPVVVRIAWPESLGVNPHGATRPRIVEAIEVEMKNPDGTRSPEWLGKSVLGGVSADIHLEPQPDGSLLARDVPAGEYLLQWSAFTLLADGDGNRTGQRTFKLVHHFTVDPVEGGYSEEPLDLGTLTPRSFDRVSP